MTKKINWRLSKLPTPDEVRELVKDKIITQDEARDILFKEETEEERDVDSLKTEIKFLRKLVEKLSERQTIIETIRTIEKPYIKYDWYHPYHLWYETATTDSIIYTDAVSGTSNSQGGNVLQLQGTTQSFSQISNF